MGGWGEARGVSSADLRGRRLPDLLRVEVVPGLVELGATVARPTSCVR
jgi:hypothetical protein